MKMVQPMAKNGNNNGNTGPALVMKTIRHTNVASINLFVRMSISIPISRRKFEFGHIFYKLHHVFAFNHPNCKTVPIIKEYLLFFGDTQHVPHRQNGKDMAGLATRHSFLRTVEKQICFLHVTPRPQTDMFTRIYRRIKFSS